MRVGLAVVAVGFGGPVSAQSSVPPVPTPPSAGIGGVGTTGVATPAAPTRNLWSFLCPSQAQCDEIKAKCCNSALGKLFNSALLPMGGLTGGLIQPNCPGPNSATPGALAQPADSPEGAAARIKQDQAAAKARLEAVRYMATADCRYYPEAEAALINALRTDPVECVRIEAARAFASGCCCGKKTIAALTRAVNGDTKDGNPAERSECVRALAFVALRRCLECYTEPPTPPEPADRPPQPVVPVTYYQRLETAPAGAMLADARAAVARGMDISQATLRQLGGRAKTLTELVTDRQTVSVTEMPGAGGPIPPRGVAPTPMPSGQPAPGGRNLLSLWDRARQQRP